MLKKALAASLAIAVGVLSFSATAQADHRRHRHHHGDAAFAGIAGFAAGALIGSLAQPRYAYPRSYGYDYYEPAPVYVAPPPRVVYRTAPVYAGGFEPWTREWYAYCDDRYRSFNPETGYFLGYDGEYHFCR